MKTLLMNDKKGFGPWSELTGWIVAIVILVILIIIMGMISGKLDLSLLDRIGW